MQLCGSAVEFLQDKVTDSESSFDKSLIGKIVAFSGVFIEIINELLSGISMFSDI